MVFTEQLSKVSQRCSHESAVAAPLCRESHLESTSAAKTTLCVQSPSFESDAVAMREPSEHRERNERVCDTSGMFLEEVREYNEAAGVRYISAMGVWLRV
jgi:hypothetical protein